MTKTVKNTLKSVLVMAVIAVVAVGLLAVANAFFPEYEAKLDKKTAALINTICPTEVDAETAMNDGYIVMAAVDKEKLAALNAEHGADKSNKVLAVYEIKKGKYTGYRVVESQAQGYGGNPVIVILTAFDQDGNIDSIAVKQQKENPTGEKNIFTGQYFTDFLAYVKNKPNAGTAEDIKAATHATNNSSIKGLANAVNVAAAVLDGLYGEGV